MSDAQTLSRSVVASKNEEESGRPPVCSVAHHNHRGGVVNQKTRIEQKFVISRMLTGENTHVMCAGSRMTAAALCSPFSSPRWRRGSRVRVSLRTLPTPWVEMPSRQLLWPGNDLAGKSSDPPRCVDDATTKNSNDQPCEKVDNVDLNLKYRRITPTACDDDDAAAAADDDDNGKDDHGDHDDGTVNLLLMDSPPFKCNGIEPTTAAPPIDVERVPLRTTGPEISRGGAGRW
jgi:hypothetical protein